MTIDEAIERLKRLQEGLDMPLMIEEYNALQLGIEALKRFKLYRMNIMPPGEKLLPGETED